MPYGVMATHKILILGLEVRILLGQQMLDRNIRRDNGGCLPVLETGGRGFESHSSDNMRKWRNGIRV